MRIAFLFMSIFFFVRLDAQSLLSVLDSDMVMVKGGSFKMGSASGRSDEMPVHEVKLTDFLICKYEVTQALWRLLMGNDEGCKIDCSDCPVYDRSWSDIQTFLSRLNQKTGMHYRLPTEAEWEYAAAGGSKSMSYKYSGSNDLDEVAWYELNSGMKTHRVGQKKPNELGLFDMSGNVWELCSDWYKGSFYKLSINENPANTYKGWFRISRGGSWRSPEQRCQVRARNRDIHDHHIGNGGFRLVRDL